MWRAGNHDDDFLEDPAEFEHEPARVQTQVTSPHALSLGDPSYSAVNVAEPTWNGWRAQLAAVLDQPPYEPALAIEVVGAMPAMPSSSFFVVPRPPI